MKTVQVVVLALFAFATALEPTCEDPTAAGCEEDLSNLTPDELRARMGNLEDTVDSMNKNLQYMRQLVKTLLITEVEKKNDEGAVLGPASDYKVSANAEDDVFASEPDWDGFQKWLQDGGAINKINQEGKTTADVKRMESVLSVPSSLYLTSSAAMASPFGRGLLSARLNPRSRDTYLASFLLLERFNPKSFWRAYISTLPREYPNIPIFWEESELEALEGTAALKKVSVQKESIEEDYVSLKKAMPSFEAFTLEQYTWARVTVAAKGFGLARGRISLTRFGTSGLVPVADVAAHSPGGLVATLSDNNFILAAPKAISKDTKVSIDVQLSQCNSQWLVDTGVAFLDNEANSIALPVNIPDDPASPQFRLKSDLLFKYVNNPEEGESGETKDFNCVLTGVYNRANKDTLKCLGFLRLALMDEQTLAEMDQPDLVPVRDLTAISVLWLENEYDMYTYLTEQLLAYKAGFETTLVEDLAAASVLKVKVIKGDADVKTMNQYHAILERLGEKQLIETYLEFGELITLLWDMMKVKDIESIRSRSSFNAFIAENVKGQHLKKFVTSYFDDTFWLMMHDEFLEIEGL